MIEVGHPEKALRCKGKQDLGSIEIEIEGTIILVGQLQLVPEDIDEAVAALEAAEDRADPKTCERRTADRSANRSKLPEHLPRIVETPDAR